MEPYKIEFGHIGVHIGTRFAGASVRERIERVFNETKKFIFDFTGVETLSESFADECFAKLIEKFDMSEIQTKSDFVNANPFIKGVIKKAYIERMRKKANE
ncbi:MAG: STAS-like domain-containing protein [Candidatus Pacebacteria bacterium]|nr:STAS-like domain-containing protein [Candidatus Paceibacterota bacterium]